MSDDARTSLAGSTLDDVRHVCALFNDDEEEYRVLLPFISEGFHCGDKGIHVVNPDQRGDHLSRLAAAGIDTAAAERTGQLDLRDNTSTYLLEGRFDQDRILGTFQQIAGTATDHGFRRNRILCRMDWAAERALVDDVVEFEAHVNDIWRHHDDIVICTYHAWQFRGDALLDIVRTHPMVIVGGLLQRNPFFIPPEQFLARFRRRHTERTSRAGGET